MARLNEPAVPTESIESLKRKFMRQNRDIARANSTQSLRIRNLENETSRLLAENLGLREQILRLQNELENGKAQRVADNTTEVKSELEAKLSEIGALISSLGDDPAGKTKSPRRGKITRSSPTQSPDQKNWKNMCTLSEAVGAQEGKLPPILENKSYPRRTLEQQELQQILSDAALDSTDSPDIGPPPVSQFVDEDPVKIDLPSRPRKREEEYTQDLDPVLSVHLEQRKKRKDSIGGPEARRASKSDHLLDIRESTGSLKAGAKRKLSVREDDERIDTTKESDDSPSDFKFTRGVSEERTRRKSALPSEKPLLKATRELAIARGGPREKQLNVVSSTRKALAPKTVNSSPKKASRTQLVDEMKSAKPDISRASSITERVRERRQESLSVQPLDREPALDIIEVQPEPETPANLDIFSPSSSQPSTTRAESRDTPPPSDLGLGTEGQRPSRRARGSVSYAEPNLRDKMRRPTKELVDAVVVDDKAHRKSFIKSEENAIPAAITIKAESDVDDSWKRMPLASSSTVENSPLSGKVSVPDSLPSSITTHRKRRESLLQNAGSDIPRSSSVNAISALLASNRKAKTDTKEKGVGNANTNRVTGGDIDIYDFRGSSPTAEGHVPRGDEVKTSKEEKPVSRVSRRHSTMSRDMGMISDSEASDIDTARKAEGPSSRRRQSSLGIRNSNSSTKPKGDDTERLLKKASSTTGLTDLGVDGTRSDRIAARRRSMML